MTKTIILLALLPTFVGAVWFFAKMVIRAQRNYDEYLSRAEEVWRKKRE